MVKLIQYFLVSCLHYDHSLSNQWQVYMINANVSAGCIFIMQAMKKASTAWLKRWHYITYFIYTCNWLDKCEHEWSYGKTVSI